MASDRTGGRTAAVRRSNTVGLREPWKPGESGNPGGKAKGYVEFLAAMRERSPRAIEILDAALNSEEFERQQWAMQQVLDRAWGKAPQAITGEGGEGGVVFVAIDTGIRRNRPPMLEQKAEEGGE